MNFKKLAEQKIDELSGKKTPEKIIDKDSVELVLEGLDEDHSEKTLNEAEQDLELEFDEETVENLFDGYLGEQKEVPNPLDYGPNATYRNLREGVVYKKGPDNLWETFVKDGTPGRNGQASPGGGCGVAEVKQIIISDSKVVSKEGWYVVATDDASDDDKLRANLILGKTNVSNDFSSVFTSDHPKIMLVGKFLQLDSDITISGISNINLYSPTNCTIITNINDVAPDYNNPSYSFRLKGFETLIVPRNTLSGSSLKGTNKIVHNDVTLQTKLSAGDYIHIQTNIAHNINRPSESCKGELNRVYDINTSAMTLEICLRDDYSLSSCLINKVSYIDNITVKNINFIAREGTISRPALLTIENGMNVGIIDCSASGKEAVCGLTVIECLNTNIISPVVSGIADSNNITSWTGYGVYIVGGENFYIQNMIGIRCRHTIDFGTQGSYARSIPRYGLVVGGCAKYNYSAGYSTHDSEYISFVDNSAIYCGGGFIARGTYTRLIRPVVIGTHADTPSFYPSSQTYQHGITIGEPDTPYISAAGGRGGEGLIIEQPVIDFTGTTPGAHAILSYDPLVDSKITANINPLKMQRTGLIVTGDTILNSKIDIYVDGSIQFNPGSGDSYGFAFKPDTNSSATQGIKDSEITVICKNIRGNSCYIGGGRNGGSSDRNKISVKVTSLNSGGGATSATPQLVFNTNTHGRYELNLDTPLTTSATAISAAPGSVYWKPNNFYLEGVTKTL